jgi:methylated-DNA-[protein]-cysteine S-methyltransferase
MKTTFTQAWLSPLGPMTLAATAQGLCGAWFDGQRHGPTPARLHSFCVTDDHPVLQDAVRQLQAFFAASSPQHSQTPAPAQPPPFDLPLDLSAGTAFQQSVWRALLRIAPGHSETYGELARHLAKPKAVRAVGAAVGRNPVSIFVPCHRILGAGGQLTGYAGGLWRKQALLQLEGHPLMQSSYTSLFSTTQAVGSQPFCLT